jgi:hypothetical protein
MELISVQDAPTTPSTELLDPNPANLFQAIHTPHSRTATPDKEHEAMTRVRNFDHVRFSNFLIKTWYVNLFTVSFTTLNVSLTTPYLLTVEAAGADGEVLLSIRLPHRRPHTFHLERPDGQLGKADQRQEAGA